MNSNTHTHTHTIRKIQLIIYTFAISFFTLSTLSATDFPCTLKPAPLDTSFGSGGVVDTTPSGNFSGLYSAKYNLLIAGDTNSLRSYAVSNGALVNSADHDAFVLAPATDDTFVGAYDAYDDEDNSAFRVSLFDYNLNLLASNTQAFYPHGGVNAIQILSTGAVAVAGANNWPYAALALYSPALELTTTVLLTDISSRITALTELTSGVLIAARGNDNLGLVSYTLDGVVTNSIFYEASTIAPDFTDGSITSLAALDNGNFLAAGRLNNEGTYPFVAEFGSDLAYIRTLTVLPLPLIDSQVVQVLIDSNGKVLLLTDPYSEDDMLGGIAVTRLNMDGTPDTTFADNCIATEIVTPEIALAGAQAFVLQNDGKIVVFSGSDESSTGSLVRIGQSSVTVSSDPLTAAIQRKYFTIA